MISTAARCSDVWGWGHGSFPAMSSNAASMTAAPFSMVAIRMSWPGQSTKDRCLRGAPARMGRRGEEGGQRHASANPAIRPHEPLQLHLALTAWHLARNKVR